MCLSPRVGGESDEALFAGSEERHDATCKIAAARNGFLGHDGHRRGSFEIAVEEGIGDQSPMPRFVAKTTENRLKLIGHDGGYEETVAWIGSYVLEDLAAGSLIVTVEVVDLQMDAVGFEIALGLAYARKTESPVTGVPGLSEEGRRERYSSCLKKAGGRGYWGVNPRSSMIPSIFSLVSGGDPYPVVKGPDPRSQ